MMRSHRSRSRVRRDEYELGDITQRVNVLSRQNLSFTIVHDLDRDYLEKLRKKKRKEKKKQFYVYEKEKQKKQTWEKIRLGVFLFRSRGLAKSHVMEEIKSKSEL
jgi:hypothetical protein